MRVSALLTNFAFSKCNTGSLYICITLVRKVCDAEGEDATCQDSVPFLHLSAADHTWYLNMSTGCSQEDVPLDEAAAAALDDEAWRAVRSNPELASLLH